MAGRREDPPGFDMAALQQFMQNPEIQRMTQAIAQDPVFMEMAREMQESMMSGKLGSLGLNGEEGAANGAARGGVHGMPPGMPSMDPEKYMQAMERVMANPEFLEAAEALGRQLMTQAADPEMRVMMELFSNPENQETLESKLAELKDDPELKEVMEDIEKNGDAAMARYMNDPGVMSKLGRKFQESLRDPELQARLQMPPEGGALGAGGAERVQDPNVVSLATWRTRPRVLRASRPPRWRR